MQLYAFIQMHLTAINSMKDKFKLLLNKSKQRSPEPKTRKCYL